MQLATLNLQNTFILHLNLVSHVINIMLPVIIWSLI